MRTIRAANYLINLNTNKPAGVNMEGISEQEAHFTNNAEVIEEFEKFFMDKSKLYKLKNDIRGMVYHTLIPSYESMFTEDEVLGELKLMIYTVDKEWDKVRYPEFKQFLLSNAQNIIKKEVDRLKLQYGIEKSKKKEKPEQVKCEEHDEESQVKGEKVGDNYFQDGVTLYTAKPKNGIYSLEHYTENEIDEAEKDLAGKEERKLFDMRTFTEQNDLSKFEGTVMVILQKEKDSKLLAVFNGHMDEKKRCEVMRECNMSATEYNNANKRLLYKLRRELPIHYRSIVSASIVVHVMMWYLWKVNSLMS
jgi:hypothetical protein